MIDKNDIYPIAKDHLFSSVDQMREASLSQPQIDKIKRIRHIYATLIDYPLRKDVEVVRDLQSIYQVSRETAYSDLRIAKLIVGNFSRLSKDWHRYKFNAMIKRATAIAEIKKDANALARLAMAYGKYNELDKDEAQAIAWEQIMIQPFQPTNDPSVIGIKPTENLQQKIQKLKEKYGDTDVEDVSFDPVDINKDKFNLV